MSSAGALALTISRDQIVAGAAIIQAASAAIILFLTGRLVTATKKYAESSESLVAETKKMVDHAAEERKLHYRRNSEEAARHLLSATRNAQQFYKTTDRWNAGYEIWHKAWLDHSESILEPELRDCIDRLQLVLGWAPKALAELPDRYGNLVATNKEQIGLKVLIAMGELVSTLADYIRGEPVQPCQLPNVGRQLEYLTNTQPGRHIRDFADPTPGV